MLLVDDEAPIRKLVCRVCQNLGVSECVQAANVREALAILESRTVDLVISDLNMPDETGLVLLKAVKSGKHPVPVIIFSGSLNNSEEDKLRQAGADLIITKAAELPVIERAIRRFTGLHG